MNMWCMCARGVGGGEGEEEVSVCQRCVCVCGVCGMVSGVFLGCNTQHATRNRPVSLIPRWSTSFSKMLGLRVLFLLRLSFAVS